MVLFPVPTKLKEHVQLIAADFTLYVFQNAVLIDDGERRSHIIPTTVNFIHISSVSAEMNEYLIAADLTLYANPLNAALASKSVQDDSSKTPEPETPTTEVNTSLGGSVAADLTRHGDPLSELDKMRLVKKAQHEENDLGTVCAEKSASSSESFMEPVEEIEDKKQTE